jgi:class 3 adenylate cyclase
MMGTFIMGYEVSDLFALHIKEHTLQDNIVWHKDAATSHLLGSSDPSLKSLLEPVMANGGINDEATVNGHRILHASIEDDKDVLLNPEGLHIDLVASLDAKLQAFRKLEYSLALMAFITLLLGFMVGLWLSRPIADPLVSLANAADCVARGQLNVADDMMLRHPQRLHAKDEIGVLGRSFLRMVQGLKERLAMSTFLSEATYQHIKRNAQDEFASERTSLAILFADVRQFSNFAETRDPEAVIQLLNQVLSIEAEIVKKHGGDIDKFVGDALVAWFSGQDRCQRAIHAATEMMSALQARFNGEPGTKIGAGIHVGDVVVGSIGSSARKDYTAIGAVVNMAARLCSNAHPGQVLVSEAVRAELGENANLNPLPPISLKGFSEPVPVFEVMTGKAVGA